MWRLWNLSRNLRRQRPFSETRSPIRRSGDDIRGRCIADQWPTSTRTRNVSWPWGPALLDEFWWLYIPSGATESESSPRAKQHAPSATNTKKENETPIQL